jgi:tetratricopeptide (TPR) repeat protein
MKEQINKTPYDSRVYLVLGDFLTKVGGYNDAIAILEKAQTISPKYQQIAFNLGHAYLAKADGEKNGEKKAEYIAKGLQLIEDAYNLYPNAQGAQVPYVSALVVTGKIKEAAKVIEGMQDTTLLVNQTLATFLIKNGYKNTAISLLKKAIVVNDKNAEAHLLLADVYSTICKRDEAVAELVYLKGIMPQYVSEVDRDIAAVNASKSCVAF